MEKKICSKCGVEKNLTQFSPRKDRIGKVLSACKDCRAVFYKNKRPQNTRLSHLCKADSLRWHSEKRQARTKKATLQTDPEWDLFFSQSRYHLCFFGAALLAAMIAFARLSLLIR